MREQLTRDMLLSIDWTRELSTCDPDYYKWTQWLFIKLYKAGLAYRRLAVVNWDPVDQTVLANELVDAEGRSWRSGAMVTKRIMRQWYFRTLAYSKSLVEGLKEIEGNQWREVIQMQRGWLGPVDGVVLEFDLLFNAEDRAEFEGERIAVYTQQPGLAASEAVSYIAVGSQHLLWNPRFREPVDRRGPNGSRKLVLTNSQSFDNGSPAYTCSRKLAVMSAAQCAPWPEKLAIRAKSLLSDRLIPVVYDPSLRSPVEYETAIDLGVPDLDGHHEEVSNFLDLPPPPTRIEVLSTSSEEHSVVIHSTFAPQFSGLTLKDANELAIKLLQGRDFRLYPCSEHRKDWLVSRQRYWATPIPLIHCSNCGTVPVPESDLPVLLPPLEKAFKRGAVPLKENENWLNTTCPQCGSPAQRETDTLDTFVDSSWYYLRFLDPTNSEAICSQSKAAQSLPVHIYVGGIEHAIRHLFYARFIAHFLYDLGITPCREPFRQFLPVGLVLGQTFMDPRTGRFYARGEVEEVALPGEVLTGVKNWQSRMWRLVVELSDFAKNTPVLSEGSASWPSAGQKEDHLRRNGKFVREYMRAVDQVNHHYSKSFVLSSVIANLQKLTSLLLKVSSSTEAAGPTSPLYLRALADLLVMLCPLSPAFACELWEGYRMALSLAPPSLEDSLRRHSAWPYDLRKDLFDQPFPEAAPVDDAGRTLGASRSSSSA
ncbi:hypothetical protein AAHC03_01765 [Spirometra sp. Aus1]